jgi:hypothetical protein
MADDINAYEILLKRHLNDDRLMGERSSIFIASSAILFAGFAVLGDTAWELRIGLCVFGIILSVFAIMSNYRTSKGLGFWDKGERYIEEHGKNFTYMKEKQMMPHTVYGEARGGIRNRHIYTYFLPSFFIALWIGSLIWVIC